MKRNIYIILLFCAAMFGCKKEMPLRYSSQDNIYLNYPAKDTLSYSFALYPSLASDTIWVPVIISGKREKFARHFQMSVVADSTTAVASLDYVPLLSSYTMPADSGTVNVPVIIKSTDTALNSKSVCLTIRISGGTDFATQLGESIRTKQILFSNRLQQPDWWPFWASSLGNFSRTKYQLFIISSGTIDLVSYTTPNFYLLIPRDLFYISNFQAFLVDPFGWVSQNSTSGYVLTPRNDGTGDYDFYNVSSPSKKTHLKYLQQTNTYVFIDENGNPVTTN